MSVEYLSCRVNQIEDRLSGFTDKVDVLAQSDEEKK
jgi:hypothetical protein